ncbi:MAG: non-canonical purine NTP pyrophosphatase [bacterium]|nr:non-canonical purine NTP pyrophosphatase [bacterium]
MDITLITSNKDKLRETEQILGITLKSADIELDEIQELDAKKVAEHKVNQAYARINAPVFVWDLSMYIDCLNGFPGPLIKWFWQQATLGKICEIANYFNNHKVYTETILCYHDGKEVRFFLGRTDGLIPRKPLGDKGWGWDPIFIPDGQTKTYAEMEREEAVRLRCAAIAIKKFKDSLA